jgi:hypothetical protein
MAEDDPRTTPSLPETAGGVWVFQRGGRGAQTKDGARIGRGREG